MIWRLQTTLLLFSYVYLLLNLFPDLAQARVYGIDLTSSYGTIIGDGQNAYIPGDKAKIYGGPEYEDLMRRLSSPSSRHLSPPYKNTFEEILDKPRQLLRRARKYLAQPPSNDVRILNDMLQKLHLAILGRSPLTPFQSTDYKTTGTAIDLALVSFPSLPGLYEEDIFDSLYFYGILPETGWVSVTPYKEYNHPHVSRAGYVGYGCGNLRDGEGFRGEEEENLMVYTIEYTNTSIYAHLSRMSPKAELKYEPYNADRTITAFDLGYADLERRTDEDLYWAEIMTFLSQLPYKFQSEGPIDSVNLLGDGILPSRNARGKKFKDIITGIVKVSQDDGFVVRDDDPEFAAAKGARVLARRWIEGHPEESERVGLPVERFGRNQVVFKGCRF